MDINERVVRSKVLVRQGSFKAVEYEHSDEPKHFIGEVGGVVVRVYNTGKLSLERQGVFVNMDEGFKDLYERLRELKVNHIKSTFNGVSKIGGYKQ